MDGFWGSVVCSTRNDESRRIQVLRDLKKEKKAVFTRRRKKAVFTKKGKKKEKQKRHKRLKTKIVRAVCPHCFLFTTSMTIILLNEIERSSIPVKESSDSTKFVCYPNSNANK